MKKLAKVIYMVPAVISLLALAGVVTMSYLMVVPGEPVYKVVNAANHTAYSKDGSIFVHREYCITDDSKVVTISRDMVTLLPGNESLRVTLDTTAQSYKKGCHSVDRILDIPDGTPAGDYQLMFRASWHVSRLQDDSVELPVLNIRIRNKTK